MLNFLAHRANLTPSYSISDLVGVSVAAAVVGVWAAVAGGSFSLLAVVACEAVFLAFYLVGSLLAGWRSLAAGVLFDLPLRLLVGYAVVNTALFALAWLSPLGIVANFGIVLGVAASLFVATRPLRERRGDWVGLLAIGVAMAAATLWCQDSIHPLSVQGENVIVKPWVDGFYHAVHVRIFGASHGASSIEDFRMAGVPARLYHYGIYLTPALIRQVSGIHSYSAFAGILTPLGIVFAGLGAYALVGSFWGKWSGLAACAALLLLPDGAQQGMGNPFMSYHWLTQISPSAAYGLALLAVAWLFVMLGCTQGSRWQLLAGWLGGAVLILYKAHFFIASILLLLLVPPLFYRGLGLLRRVLWAVSALTVYAVALVSVQKVPGVPPIRFDGSGMGDVLGFVKGFARPGVLRDFVAERIGLESPWWSNLFLGGSYVLLATLGLFAPLLVILAIRNRRRTPAVFVLLPLLLITNFMAMFLGLALDYTRSTPDELSHRPFVVMYFAVVAWVGGAAGLWLLESRRLGRLARPAIFGSVVTLMAVPAFLGSGVQSMWKMKMFSPVQVPIGLYRAAEYMRDHGAADDVFQDSQLDRIYWVAALSERRAYVARTLTRIGYNNERVEERVDAIQQFMGFRNAAAINAFARVRGIGWFLLSRGDRVAWPAEIADHPVFERDGYRLYRF